MIERNPYGGPRAVDGKQVYAILSSAHMEKATGLIVSELAEDAVAADYASMFGHVRNDQTGVVYEVAHELEDSEATYTEVFPDPRDLSEIVISGSYVSFNKNVYPFYSASKTYAKGDRVVYKDTTYTSGFARTYESDFDDNTGNTPSLYGWTVIEYGYDWVEPRYVTIEEFNQIITEENGSQEAEG